MEQALLVVFIFFIGLTAGSFLGAASYRLPRGLSLVHPPSTCPACRTRLGAKDLIPVLSYLLAKGRCRHCREPISARYPLIELIAGLGFVNAYWIASRRPGASWPALNLTPGAAETFSLHWPVFIGSILFFCLLLLMAVIDWEHMLLPDIVNVAGGAIGLGIALLGVGIVSIGRGLYGALLGFSLLALVVFFSKGGMGMGDAKFLAMLGTFLGPSGVLYALFAASAFGAAIGSLLLATGRLQRGEPFPFGPFLAAAAWGVWLYIRLIP